MSTAKNISFDDLKKAVTPEVTQRILNHFGIADKFAKEADGCLRGSCPFRCEKTSGRSFKITADGRAWFNHDRACKCLPVNEDTGQPVRGGNMLDFIRFKTGGSVRDAGLLLDTLLQPPKAGEWQVKLSKPETPAATPKTDSAKGSYNLTFVERGLKPLDLDQEHEAITSLGLELETIADFGAGVCAKGMMRGRLAFPLHNVMGELVAYTGFKLDKASDGPLWLLPKDFQPELELIGAHVPVTDASVLVITFDMLEAAYAAQTLRHPVLTILSPEISDRQEVRLKSLIEDQGFTGTFLVLAAPSEKSGSNPALIDQAVLRLARLAPTKCIVLP